MIIKIRNITNEIVTISDLSVSVIPNESIDLALIKKLYEISSSNSLPKLIANESLIVNDGSSDLPISKALQYVAYQNIPTPRDISDKQWVHETARPFGAKINFTGAGDDPSDPVDIGGGDRFIIEHEVGGNSAHSLTAYFNCVENTSYIHEGYVMWKDCAFDYISAYFVPRVCEYAAADSTAVTPYFLYGEMILPYQTLGQTNGNIVMTKDLTLGDGGLVYIPYREDGTRDLCFWDAHWNTTTKRFEDIVPMPAGNGNYNLFGQEKKLYRMANKISLVGSGFEKLQTADADQIGHGMALKFEGVTDGTDHAWMAGITLTMYRAKTC